MEKELLSRWQNEIFMVGIESGFIGIAVFSKHKNLLFANASIQKLVDGFSYQKFISPGFDKLWDLQPDNSSLIFEGFLTLGDYSRINISLPSKIFRKHNEMLIITGYDYENLQQQNENLHRLNRDINDLQRQLINEKKVLETTLQQLDAKNAELLKSNRQKDKLFSIIAHDLKSPFSGIIGFAEIVKEHIYELPIDQLAEYTNSIYRSASNTFNLIENLLEWASLQRSTIKLKPEKVTIPELLDEVIELINEQASEKKISLRVEIQPDLDWIADKNMLKSILRNLLTNAIKFSFPGKEVVISVQQNKNELYFSVTDKGIGISEEKLKLLFVNEYNEPDRGTGDEKGSGLGLAICKDFVDLNGGKIWAESEPGKGTAFTFSLPWPGQNKPV